MHLSNIFQSTYAYTHYYINTIYNIHEEIYIIFKLNNS